MLRIGWYAHNLRWLPKRAVAGGGCRRAQDWVLLNGYFPLALPAGQYRNKQGHPNSSCPQPHCSSLDLASLNQPQRSGQVAGEGFAQNKMVLPFPNSDPLRWERETFQALPLPEGSYGGTCAWRLWSDGGTTQGFLPTGVNLCVFLALNTPAIWGSQTPKGEQRGDYACLLCTSHLHRCSILRKTREGGSY